MEQVFLASIVVGNEKVADDCLANLLIQFPKSDRVNRLIAMQHEYKHEYQDALNIYDCILQESPADTQSLKRKICVYKAMNEKSKAIKLLLELVGGLNPNPPREESTTPPSTPPPVDDSCNYYGIGMNDISMWIELSELYIENCDYHEAAFCLEECVLLDASNCWYHCKLADVYYSIGGIDSYIKARKHYTISLNKQSYLCNKRSLVGLKYVCSNIIACLNTEASSSSSSSSSSSHSVPSSSSSGSGNSSLTTNVTDYNTEKEITLALIKYCDNCLTGLNTNNNLLPLLKTIL